MRTWPGKSQGLPGGVATVPGQMEECHGQLAIKARNLGRTAIPFHAPSWKGVQRQGSVSITPDGQEAGAELREEKLS